MLRHSGSLLLNYATYRPYDTSKLCLSLCHAGELEAANAKYAKSFTKGTLALPPARKLAIITCMDARFDPARALGLEEGDAHVIRNAGGRASDAVRSIIISQQLLGTCEIILIHHTDCGMLTFTDSSIRNKLKEELNQTADHIAFLPFPDLKQSIHDDIKLLGENPLILDIPITAYLYEVETGKIVKIGSNL